MEAPQSGTAPPEPRRRSLSTRVSCIAVQTGEDGHQFSPCSDNADYLGPDASTSAASRRESDQRFRLGAIGGFSGMSGPSRAARDLARTVAGITARQQTAAGSPSAAPKAAQPPPSSSSGSEESIGQYGQATDGDVSPADGTERSPGCVPPKLSGWMARVITRLNQPAGHFTTSS